MCEFTKNSNELPKGSFINLYNIDISVGQNRSTMRAFIACRCVLLVEWQYTLHQSDDIQFTDVGCLPQPSMWQYRFVCGGIDQ